MPRFNVKHDNKYYVFSTIVDDYVFECDTFEELQEWRKREYKYDCSEKTFEELDANKMKFEEAEEKRRRNR
jgi:hypothetical protein